MSSLKFIGSVALVAALVSGLAAPVHAQEATREPVSGYTQYTGQIHGLAVGQRAEDSSAIVPIGGYGVLDNAGVRMYSRDGALYDHPVAQAQYALQYLNSYRLTGNAAYLDIAKKNAQRLIDNRVETEGAWYFPYPFDFPLFGESAMTLKAPWYSGMAQGRALGVFTRLFQATGEPKWRDAADRTFASLRLAAQGDAPYAAYVDAQHRLWLEEYPNYPPANSENALNGHIFALYGLLDYWQLTADNDALTLIRGAISTVQRTAMSEFRQPNAMCLYSLQHRRPAKNYHQIHVRQFLTLYRYTHHVGFITAATAFRNDYPLTTVAGTLLVTTRTSTIYRVNSLGRITGSRRVSFSRTSSAPFDQRLRLVDGPVALRVSAGTYRGWYFPERYGVTWALGSTDVHTYAPSVNVRFEPGTYSAFKLGSNGRVVGRKTVRLTRSSRAPSPRSALVEGRGAYYIAAGSYAGYWLPMQKGVHL